MDNKTAWDTLEKITNLPTLPAVYFQVNKLLQDKQASIEKIARIIEVDPGMSSSILRLVNSAFYGLGKTCNSISHAVMILGFNAVKNAIVSVTVLDALTGEHPAPGSGETLLQRAARLGDMLLRGLAALRSPLVREVRGLGLMVGVELKVSVSPVLQRLQDRGILALPAGMTTLRLLPPLVIAEADLHRVLAAVDAVLREDSCH